MRSRALAALAAGTILAAPAAAQADVFNGRIAFSSFRTDPAGGIGDIFTINNDGTDLRQLTTNPEDDAQSDWAPDGRDIAYRIRKPGSADELRGLAHDRRRRGSQRLTVHAGRAGLEPADLVAGPQPDAVPPQRARPSRACGRWDARREPGAAVRPAGPPVLPERSRPTEHACCSRR